MWGLIFPLIIYSVVTAIVASMSRNSKNKKVKWRDHIKRLVEEFEMSLEDDTVSEPVTEDLDYESIHYEYSQTDSDHEDDYEEIDWDNYEAVFDSESLPQIEIDTYDDIDEYDEVLVEREILDEPISNQPRTAYFNSRKAREAFILSEIIQKPKSLRKQP